MIQTFTIITTAPNELTAPIHDRMPVILPPTAEAQWLNPATDMVAVQDLLQTYHADEMKAYPVGKMVGSPANNSPELIVEVKGQE